MTPTCSNDRLFRIPWGHKRGFSRVCGWLLAGLCYLTGGSHVPDSAQAEPFQAPFQHGLALYYGAPVPVRQLDHFSRVVVDPVSGFSPPRGSTRWLAYVSVGEVTANRDYLQLLPPSWLMGKNPEWQSQLIDQSPKAWPDFFVEQIIAPLWNRGYRGFFLDTLDAYRRVAHSPHAQAQQRQGEIRLLQALHQRYPEAFVILNRGFDLLPDTYPWIKGVVVESLFKGWHNAEGRYFDVPTEDRRWLLERIQEVRTRYPVPVVIVDYCPDEGPCRREARQSILQQGLIPYITDGKLLRIDDQPDR